MPTLLPRAALIALVFCIACKPRETPPITSRIDFSTGGSIADTDTGSPIYGASVTFVDGAAPGTLQVTMNAAPLSSLPPLDGTPQSALLQLGPAGSAFEPPAEVTLPVANAASAAPGSLVTLHLAAGATEYEILPVDIDSTGDAHFLASTFSTFVVTQPLFHITSPVYDTAGGAFTYTVPDAPVTALLVAGTASGPGVTIKVGGTVVPLTQSAGGSAVCKVAPCYWATSAPIPFGRSNLKVVGKQKGSESSTGAIVNGCSADAQCKTGDRCEVFTCGATTHLCSAAPKCAASTTCQGITCDPDVGHCATSNAAKTVDCDDGNACTSGDKCDGHGACAPGPAISCDDHNPCTDDSCNPASGCVHTNNDANACSDGNACNGAEACSAGVCNNTGVGACSSNATCTANACGCNPGFSGDGVTCTDIDECANGSATCGANSICTNTAGSYTCACAPGFAGTNDGRSCVDVNECTNGSASCGANSVCTNTAGSYTCACAPGFAGSPDGRSCIDINECSNGTATCGSNSICTNTAGSYSCACAPGFAGTTDGRGCADINECTNGTATCGSNSICTNTAGSYSCACASGFAGSFDGRSCVDINECASGAATCGSNSVCTNTSGSYTCACAPGFAGTTDGRSCVDVNECSNGTSTCGANSICSNTSGSYTCACAPGFAGTADGRSCVDVDECANGSATCGANSSCTNTVGSYTCACTAGFAGTTDGRSCVDVNECNNGTATCGSNSICSNTSGSYTCACAPGFAGTADGRSCADVNECSNGTATCGSNSVCTNTSGSYTCACAPGFAGTADGRSCVDVNECSNGTATCGANSLCTNTAGAYTCACAAGFSGTADGRSCVDIDECADNTDTCGDHSICSNTSGSYSCACAPGFSGTPDGRNCADINECALGTDTCGSNSSCTNTTGSYTCACAAGFSGTADGRSCVDVDECALGTATCGSNSICTNTVGSYSCACAPGFAGGADGRSCVDINECTNGTATCGSNSNCTNTAGSYTCACANGYAGTPDGRSCQPIDPCANGTATCGANSTCSNAGGGSYTCSCNSGFAGTPDGRSCVDLNECANGSATCGSNSICTNTSGSYTCACASGFAGTADGRSCVDVDECANGSATCGSNSTCTNTAGSYTCACNAGFSGTADGRSCVDINECATNNGGCGDWSSCTNSPGSYTCACKPGTVSAACTPCEAGYSCPSPAGSTTQAPCPAGSQCPAGSAAPIACLAGTYAGAGASSCTSCSPDTYSAANATSCTGCAADTFSASGASFCTSCAPGSTDPACFDKAYGRYVRVQARRFGRMGLAELQVFSAGKNVSQGMNASMSSVAGCGNYGCFQSSAAQLVDGDTTGYYYYGAITSTEATPWVQVDLGAVMPIDQLSLFALQWGEGFATDFDVELSIDGSSWLSVHHEEGSMDDELDLSPKASCNSIACGGDACGAGACVNGACEADVKTSALFSDDFNADIPSQGSEYQPLWGIGAGGNDDYEDQSPGYFVQATSQLSVITSQNPIDPTGATLTWSADQIYNSTTGINAGWVNADGTTPEHGADLEVALHNGRLTFDAATGAGNSHRYVDDAAVFTRQFESGYSTTIRLYVDAHRWTLDALGVHESGVWIAGYSLNDVLQASAGQLASFAGVFAQQDNGTYYAVFTSVAVLGNFCDDANACTTDSCDPVTACSHGATYNTNACAIGTCETATACDPSTNDCTRPPQPDHTVCDDGNPCTIGDSCHAGVCVGGAPNTCAPVDSCHSAGTCDPSSGACNYPSLPDNTVCNDNNLCNHNETCQQGACVPAAVTQCPQPDQCHDLGICNPATGACNNPNKANGALCDDGVNCTANDVCTNGVCAGTQLACGPVDQCHAQGVCIEASGTCTQPDATEGLACTIANGTAACSSGACDPLSCNSGWQNVGQVCVDIDECANHTDNCAGNQDCFNTPGSYNCVCHAFAEATQAGTVTIHAGGAQPDDAMLAAGQILYADSASRAINLSSAAFNAQAATSNIIIQAANGISVLDLCDGNLALSGNHSLTLATSNGDIVVTSPILAGSGAVSFSAGGGGGLNLGTVTTSSNLTLSSGVSMKLNGMVSGSTALLNSGGAIGGSGGVGATGVATLNASLNIGQSGARLLLAAGTLSGASTGGSYYLQQTGNLVLDALTANGRGQLIDVLGTANLNVKTITASSGSINLATTGGSIDQAGGTLTAGAGNFTASGDVGEASRLNTVLAALNVSAGTGAISINQTGDLAVGIVGTAAANKSVTINMNSGAISQQSNGLVTAGTDLIIEGIGSIGSGSARLVTSTPKADITSTTGSIYLQNAGAIFLEDAEATAANQTVDVQTVNGSISTQTVLTSATTGTVTLVALGAGANLTGNFRAANANLGASNNVGTAGQPIASTVNLLNGVSLNGSFYYSNASTPLTVGTINTYATNAVVYLADNAPLVIGTIAAPGATVQLAGGSSYTVLPGAGGSGITAEALKMVSGNVQLGSTTQPFPTAVSSFSCVSDGPIYLANEGDLTLSSLVGSGYDFVATTSGDLYIGTVGGFHTETLDATGSIFTASGGGALGGNFGASLFAGNAIGTPSSRVVVNEGLNGLTAGTGSIYLSVPQSSSISALGTAAAGQVIDISGTGFSCINPSGGLSVPGGVINLATTGSELCGTFSNGLTADTINLSGGTHDAMTIASTVNINGANSFFMNSPGPTTLGSITAGQGEYDVASGSLTLGTINLTTGTGTFFAESGALVAGSGSLLTAPSLLLEANGDVGSSGARIATNTPLLNIVASNTGWISTSGAVTLSGSHAHSIDVVSGGDLTLGTMQDAAWTLFSNGGIYSSGANAVIAGSNLSMTASASIGTADNRIVPVVSSMGATSMNGSIYLADNNGAPVDPLSANAVGQTVDLSFGYEFSLGSVSAGGAATFTATGNNSQIFDQKPGAVLTAAVFNLAVDNIDLGEGDAPFNTSVGALNLTGSNDNFFINQQGEVSLIANVTTYSNYNLVASGNITVGAQIGSSSDDYGAINLTAHDDNGDASILQGSGGLLSSYTVNLTADADIGSTNTPLELKSTNTNVTNPGLRNLHEN